MSSFQRGPQIVTLKDASLIAYLTGMKDGTVLDAGTGSAGSAAAFSLIARDVYTFEPREDHARIAEKNIARLAQLGYGKNIHLIRKSIESIRPGDYPPFTHAFLDLPQPAEKARSIHASLAPGAWLIIYTPHITQQAALHATLTDLYIHQHTLEVPVRYWHVDVRRTRPDKTILHTAFISFWRKKDTHIPED